MTEVNRYYLTEVDVISNSIYCYHDLMGEVFIQKHKHEKGQFIYTEGGVVYIRTPNKTHFLPARHYMWIPPGLEHAIYPSSPDVMMRNLYFPVKKKDHSYYFTEGIYPVNELLLQLLLYTKKWKGDITKDNKELYPIVEAFKVLLPQVAEIPLSLTLPEPRDPRLIKIVAFIRQNLDKNMLQTEIANEFGMSERTLHRLFKNDMNISFIHFYTLLRMFQASEYLLSNKFTISEVASMVGYSSVPTFSNTFLKIMGNRPSEYYQSMEILHS